MQFVVPVGLVPGARVERVPAVDEVNAVGGIGKTGARIWVNVKLLYFPFRKTILFLKDVRHFPICLP